MDKLISASKARQSFSELLREVAEGHSFTITLRGRPIARVLPVDHHQQRRSIERLLDFVSRLPIRHSASRSREALYE